MLVFGSHTLDNIDSGRERVHLHQGAAGRDEVHGPEPHRGRGAGARHGGRPQRGRNHRFPRVPADDEEEKQ